MDLAKIYQQNVASGALVVDPAQVAILPELQRIADALAQPVKSSWFRKAPDAAKGLYLWGGVGRGKSMLMDLFARSVGPVVRRVHFHAFMQEVHKGMAAARAKGAQDAILPVADDIAADIRCLAFDEMQINDITDAMIVGRLFEQLLERGVILIATSNRHPEDLYKDGLNRALFLPFIDVLQDRLTVWELATPTDYRLGKLTGKQCYFTPLGPKATAGVDAVWLDLAGGPGRAMELVVKSRTVTLPEFRNGIARIDFDGLCAVPLGAADYLAIAEAAKVLILDNIPILGPDNNNEAKRFVTLIDALYEARTHFIASAAAEPEALYPEGRGSFEFERTASRLREMQAESWLKV